MLNSHRFPEKLCLVKNERVINVFLLESDYFLHKRYFNITSVEGMEEIVRIKHLIKLEKRQCLSHFWLENKYRRESDMPLLK